jgi:predicted alpha-1,2-mannosidase
MRDAADRYGSLRAISRAATTMILRTTRSRIALRTAHDREHSARRMLFALVTCALIVTGTRSATRAQPPSLASSYVNTLRGSDSTPGYSYGNTFPAVTLPFGFNFWTPVTNSNENGWIYNYQSRTLEGFAISHMPSPWIGDHASLQVMPSIGTPELEPQKRAAGFTHARELARPHVYEVTLDSGIRVEIAPSEHGAIWRFTFPEGATTNLLFDTIDAASGSISADATGRSVSGYVDHRGPRFYFHAEIDQRVARVFDPEGGGVNIGITLAANAARVVTMRIGTSFLSVDQAKAHLHSELAGKRFEQVRDEARSAWDALLTRVQVDGASEAQRVTLYSNLYRAFMYPNSRTERVDGAPQHWSPYANRVAPGVLYVNNGFWDTYRAAWPLYLLLMPEQAGRMLDGFVNAYKEGGWIPRWSGPGYLDVMVGTHSDVVLADAFLKGVRNFDVDAAYASMLKNGLVFSGDGARGRKGNGQGIFRGYIPLEEAPESAAWHLENCVADFGISRMAELLGDRVHADYFRDRSLSYVNLFSSTTGFFRGRGRNGAFRTPDETFKPNEWGYEFTEGAAWQYVAAANHDPRGMANLYGGDQGFASKLDAVVSAPRDYLQGSYPYLIHEMREAYDTNMGQYAHANEPVHHLLYMFAYAGQPWKTQQYVREVLSEQKGIYGPGYDGRGYLGDEDNGQMSAWYVFSALGLYPASPGHDEYVIGSPLHARMSLRLESGASFSVVASNNAPENMYVQRATLEGAPLTRSYLTHAEIVRGGTLELEMGPQPSTWASRPEDRPSSVTRDSRVPAPLVDCTRDAVVTASAEHRDFGEGAAESIDDDSATKWLAFEATGNLQFALAAPCTVHRYTLTSANDFPERDPTDFTLEGSEDGVDWQVLDRRVSEHFEWRRQTRVFALDAPATHEQFRLVISRNHGAAITQLAEIELQGREAAKAATKPSPESTTSQESSRASRGCDVGCGSAAPYGFGLLAGLGWLLMRRKRSRREG